MRISLVNGCILASFFGLLDAATVEARETLAAEQKLDVSICNYGKLPVNVVKKAQLYVARCFDAVRIHVIWTECGAGPDSKAAAEERWFTVRLRSDTSPRMQSATSLDAMGFAYTSTGIPGNLLDAFYPAIRATANSAGIDEEDLLGCVIVHEIGHLLLGPGHGRIGVMQAEWKFVEFQQIRKHWLTFDAQQTRRIRLTLNRNAEESPGSEP